jgi:dTDP-4-amino-4,6-dideoxygalactose transaminase
VDSEFLPFHVPSLGEEEIAEVVATLRSGWLTTGPRTAQFEKEFATYVQAPHAQAVNSCTAGLHLALAALGVGPGHEVITTPLTFCATVNTILHVGAVPVLADVDADGNIDPASIAEMITPRTKALMPVHLAGKPCRMDEIWELARRHNLFVVEDAAHAAGTRYAGYPIGAGNPRAGYYSDAVAFSFYATKNLTTGEGGMVTTHRPELYEHMKRLCLHGINRDAWNRYTAKGNWFYEVSECGFKYNLSDIQSSIGIHQLRKLEAFTGRRAELAAMYEEGFRGVDEVETPVACSGDSRHAWHLYMIKLRLEHLAIDRAAFIKELNSSGIGTSVHFIPIPLHPYYSSSSVLGPSRWEEANRQYLRSISLPLYPGMMARDVTRVVDSVTNVVHNSRREDVLVRTG